MPSFLGRFLGLTFRTELLIMNILGLINSTLDWSPLKWTNKLEQIWNFSMPQKSLIVDTIGEDTIKTILSWIVITRIVIAHVYTFTYLSNIYPIITWSKPNLLLPWLILSFFKNVVLEVIVIVIGLLLWYGSPFSLVVFLEFIFVKLVPLILASYNWYCNSCLFLQLRRTEKMKRLHRSMRSDSNLLTNQLYVKIDDPRYRTGSLTTLFSYDSYETYNPNLTPGQNAKKLLGITDQDIEDARVRVRQTKAHRRLTEIDDDIYLDEKGVGKVYLMDSSVYESDMLMQRISHISTMYQEGEKHPETIRKENQPGAKENPQRGKDEEVDEDLEENRSLGEQSKGPETIEARERLTDFVTVEDLEKIEEEEEEDAMVINPTGEDLATKKREATDLVESPRVKQQRARSPTHEKDQSETMTRPTEVDSTSTKLQALFSCNCTEGDSVLKESLASSVKTTDMRTSTPRERSEDENKEPAEENSKTAFDQPYTYTYNVTDVKADFTMNSGFPLMEKLLKKDLEILKSIKAEVQNSKKCSFDDVLKIPKEDRSNMFLDGYGNHRNPPIDLQNISEIVKDLGVSTKTMSTLKTEEYGSDRRQTGNGGAEDGSNRLQNATSCLHAWRLEEDVSKLNLGERARNDPDMSRFYKDSMKAFDGFYQNDFANNSELQCALQQMEKKKWNPFSGQTNLETLLTTAYPERDPPSLIDSWRPEEMCDSSGSTSRRSGLTEDSQSPKIDINRRHPQRPSKTKDAPKPVVVSEKKNVGTQTNPNEAGHLIDAKPRWKYYRRRKRTPDQSGSVTRMKKDSSCLLPVKRSNSPMLPKSLNDRMRLHASKSFLNKNDCECKMQKLGGKCSPSTDSSFEKREEGCRVNVKRKVDSLATLPLAQVIRKPEANRSHSRKKPPVYPKDAQMDSWWRTPSDRIAESSEPTRTIDRQSTNSSRTSSSRTSIWRNRQKKSSVDQAARELRALKAYNEITLRKDKRELEAQKNLGRVAPNRDARSSNKRVTSRIDLGKENLSANAANETGYSSRSNKLPPNAGGRSATASNEKHSSKPSKVVKTSEKQKNFDRLAVAALRSQQSNAELADVRRTPEKTVLFENSDVKLESAVTGRELNRSKAKEDVRASAASSVEAVPGRLEFRIEKSTARDAGRDEASRADVEDLKFGNKELLTLMTKSVKEDAAPTLSTSSVDLGTIETGSSDEAKVEDLPIVEEEVLEDTSDDTAGSMQLAREEVNQARSVRGDEEDNRGNSLIPASLTWRKRDSNADLWGNIVDNVTPAMLHNFYSYKMVDSLLHDSTMEEFSTFSEQVDRFGTNLPAILEAQCLGDAPRPLTICSAAMDQENLPDDLEMKASICEIEDGQGIRLNEEQLYDILNSVTEVLRNLNIDEHAESRRGTQETTLKKIVEIFDDVLEDGFQDNGEIPKCIKGDIFTDIRFPIVITAAEISPDLKNFNAFPLRLRLDRDAEIVEPIRSDLDDLTSTTGENDEDAEEAGVSLRTKLASSCKFLGSRRFDEFEDAVEVEEANVYIEEDYQSVVDETFSCSTEYATVIELPSYVNEFAGNASKANLNETYDINGCSNEDETSFRIEEIHGNIGEYDAYEAETSIGTEKVRKVFALEDDQRGTMDAEIDEVIVKLTEAVRIEIEGSVDLGKPEGRVQDYQIGEEDFEYVTEMADTENAMEYNEDSLDETTEEETEIRVVKERVRAEKIGDGSRSEETVFHRVEQVEESGYRNVTVRRHEESERVRRVDKHAQEEDVGNEALGDGVLVEEAEDSAKDVDAVSSTETGQSHASILKFENVRLLDPIWEPNTVPADAEKRIDLVPKKIDRSIVKEEKVSASEIVPEETGVSEATEELSLSRILMFWLLVFYFYIRHFYRWMCSLTQVSRTTYTLRPFEVHTVSTSTSTLIEHAALLNSLREKVEEDEETLETSVDLETANISKAIEERLRAVLDLTSERSVSRNSEFGMEEMAEELRRETLDLGLSFGEYPAEGTRSTEEKNVAPKNDRLDVQEAIVKIDGDTGEVRDAGNRSSSTDGNKVVESSSGEGTSAVDKVNDSVERTGDSPVQFETTLEDMDSFYSLYTRPSVTTDTISYGDLEGDDMEEFSLASNTSNEPAQT